MRQFKGKKQKIVQEVRKSLGETIKQYEKKNMRRYENNNLDYQFPMISLTKSRRTHKSYSLDKKSKNMKFHKNTNYEEDGKDKHYFKGIISSNKQKQLKSISFQESQQFPSDKQNQLLLNTRSSLKFFTKTPNKFIFQHKNKDTPSQIEIKQKKILEVSKSKLQKFQHKQKHQQKQKNRFSTNNSETIVVGNLLKKDKDQIVILFHSKFKEEQKGKQDRSNHYDLQKKRGVDNLSDIFVERRKMRDKISQNYLFKKWKKEDFEKQERLNSEAMCSPWTMGKQKEIDQIWNFTEF